MWWGRGDTSQLNDDEKTTLGHLHRFEETGHLTTLNDRQAGVAVRAVEFYNQWESLLRLMTSFKNIAILVGALLAIYWATGDFLVTQLRTILGAP